MDETKGKEKRKGGYHESPGTRRSIISSVGGKGAKKVTRVALTSKCSNNGKVDYCYYYY